MRLYIGKLLKWRVLCSKTGISPFKAKITLPGLELNGALLLAEMVSWIISTSLLDEAPVCWDDSTIMLL